MHLRRMRHLPAARLPPRAPRPGQGSPAHFRKPKIQSVTLRLIDRRRKSREGARNPECRAVAPGFILPAPCEPSDNLYTNPGNCFLRAVALGSRRLSVCGALRPTASCGSPRKSHARAAKETTSGSVSRRHRSRAWLNCRDAHRIAAWSLPRARRDRRNSQRRRVPRNRALGKAA